MKIRMKILKRLAFITIACLFVFSPVKAQSTLYDYDGDLIENLNKKLGVRLPAEYESKVKELFNIVMAKDGPISEFVEQFIIEQMKQDWKISKQNQLLFLWSDIYTVFRKKDLIDIYEVDEQTLKDLEDVVDKLISLEEPIKAAWKNRFEELKKEGERERELTIASLTRSLNMLLYINNIQTMKNTNILSRNLMN